jgi:integrase
MAAKRSADKDQQMLAWFAQNDTFARLDLAEITPDVIAAARSKLAEGLSENTVNKYMALMRSLLRKASTEWGWIAAAPRVPMYRIRQPDPRWLSKVELARLLRHLPEHTADMAKLAVLTGLRRANITGLTWDRVDLKRATAFIPGTQAKGAKGIAVPLSAEAVRVLKRWRGQHQTHVFVYRGSPVYQVATRAWREAVKAAGLSPGFRFHDLRHTWASWQVQAETPLSVLQELGGWASFEMVRRYAHLSPGHLKRYANRVKLGTLAGHTRRAKLEKSP